MEEQAKFPVFKASLIYGLIVGMAMVVVNLILYFLDQSLKNWVMIFIFILMVALSVGALVLARNEYGKGFIRYGQVVLVSLLIGIISSVLISVYNYTVFTMDEEYFQDVKYVALDRMEKQYDKMEARYEEKLSDDQLDTFLDRLDEQKRRQIKRFNERSATRYAFSGIFSGIIMGLIIGLLAGIFIKKTPEFTEYTN